LLQRIDDGFRPGSVLASRDSARLEPLAAAAVDTRLSTGQAPTAPASRCTSASKTG
jgi:hypothetical protein